MIMPDEKAKSAIAFLKAAVAYYNSLGVTVAGVMTDSGSCYKAFAFERPRARLRAMAAVPTPSPHPRVVAADAPQIESESFEPAFNPWL